MKLIDLKGEWAVITGASSGIGREFCERLAAHGVNLIVVARRAHRLNDLAQKLGKMHGVQCVVVAQDLARAGGAEQVRMAASERGIRPRLLVNNAGCGHWELFSRASAEFYEGMMMLNGVTPVVLCRLFEDDLASHACAAVINVSSPAVFQPIPYMAVYAASKSALHSFSLALSEEWREKGILVQTLLPAPTVSEFDSIAGDAAGALGAQRESASVVVSLSLRELEKGSILVSSAPGVFKQRLFGGLFPPAFVVKKVAQIFRPPKKTVNELPRKTPGKATEH